MTRIRESRISALAAALAVAAVLVIGNSALAVPVGALATTSDAISSGGPDAGFWRGSHQLTGGLATFIGTLDFAVFAPGDFQSFLDTEYAGDGYTDLTGDSEYIYAFQFRSDTFPPSDPQDPSAPIQTLNAGYDVGADIGSLAQPGSLLGSGDTGPNTTSYNASSARWDWGFAASVANGQISDVLYYSSNRPPKPDFATLGARFLLDQADSGPNDYASPAIPEPASLVGMIISVVGLGLVTGRRRRK